MRRSAVRWGRGHEKLAVVTKKRQRPTQVCTDGKSSGIGGTSGVPSRTDHSQASQTPPIATICSRAHGSSTSTAAPGGSRPKARSAWTRRRRASSKRQSAAVASATAGSTSGSTAKRRSTAGRLKAKESGSRSVTLMPDEGFEEVSSTRELRPLPLLLVSKLRQVGKRVGEGGATGAVAVDETLDADALSACKGECDGRFEKFGECEMPSLSQVSSSVSHSLRV
mmetsp:Transcript_41832/g.89254  ORF Transcript_41832/g.89254 Transcript_41832/m.89254 type:complete len:224 (+) Transcript_41832:1051-1722(+)